MGSLPWISCDALTFISLALLIGAMGKSAQMPLQVWLADSMEGPTPISALIHAATMVTAGVFMVARLSFLFEHSETTLNTLLLVGATTCFFMALVALVQTDIKRIIAYSTMSQLGYMMMAMGASAYSAGIFHLLTHACFKALLFLSAGSIMMALHHEQNIEKMGALRQYLPLTYMSMLIGILALIGFPLFSGFYSKDLIIEALQHSTRAMAPLAYGSAVLGIFLTTFYSFRLFFRVFHGKINSDLNIHTIHKNAWSIKIPLILLALCSVVVGGLFIRAFSEGFLSNALGFFAPGSASLPPTGQGAQTTLLMTPTPIGILGFLLNILGIGLCYLCYVRYPQWPTKLLERSLTLARIYRILGDQYGMDRGYLLLVQKLKNTAQKTWCILDQLIIDQYLVHGLATLALRASAWVRLAQTGYIYHYVLMMMVGLILLGGFLIVSVR